MHRYVQWGIWLLPDNLPRKWRIIHLLPTYASKARFASLCNQRAKPAVRPGFIYDPNASCLKHSAHSLCPVG